MRLDITMPAVLRPAILEQTLDSLLWHVRAGARELRLFLHIDEVGPGSLIEMRALAEDQVTQCITHVNTEPSLNVAMKWLWSQDLEPIFLHCEDDVLFTCDIDLEPMFELMEAYPHMAYLAIPRRGFHEGDITSDHNLQHWLDVRGAFHWRAGKYRLSFGPGLVRREFAQRAAELIQCNAVDPEIQFHHRNAELQAWTDEWTFATFARVGDARAVRDIGKEGRSAGGWVKSVQPTGTTWIRQEGHGCDS